jgi:uncharacterized protein
MTDHSDTASPGPETVYFQFLREGRFRIQRCTACGIAVFYPRVLCPHCGANDLSWIEPTGNAVVYSTTIVRRKADSGGDYNVALLDLEEGPRMMARVEGIAPEAIRIGMRVSAHIHAEGESTVVIFRPQGDVQ